MLQVAIELHLCGVGASPISVASWHGAASLLHWLWWGLAAVGLVVADRLLLWAEDRDWIYYRTRKASFTSVGTALFQLQAIIQPEKQYVVEQQLEIREDSDADGAPPPPTWDVKPPKP